MSDELIPIGSHEVQVASISLRRSRRGTDMLVIEFVDDRGRHIRWYGFWHTEKSYEWLSEILTMLGWDPIEHKWDLSQIVGTERLVGVPCQIQVVPSEYDGHKSRRVMSVGASVTGGLGYEAHIQYATESLRSRCGEQEGGEIRQQSPVEDDVDPDEIPF